MRPDSDIKPAHCPVSCGFPRRIVSGRLYWKCPTWSYRRAVISTLRTEISSPSPTASLDLTCARLAHCAAQAVGASVQTVARVDVYKYSLEDGPIHVPLIAAGWRRQRHDGAQTHLLPAGPTHPRRQVCTTRSHIANQRLMFALTTMCAVHYPKTKQAQDGHIGP